MNDTIFLSVAFGPKYIEQQYRLMDSIIKIYPEPAVTFWYDGLPYDSKPHNESLYGFKVHAVKFALEQGYEKIIWLDPACILQHTVDYWFNLNQPILAAKDDNLLSAHIGNKALQYFGNPDISGMHLVGGSVYVFDFSKPLCGIMFEQWAKAEADGIFGSQQEQASGKINKHRNDESCLAYLMYKNGVEPVNCDLMRYNQNEESIIIKKHFK